MKTGLVAKVIRAFLPFSGRCTGRACVVMDMDVQLRPHPHYIDPDVLDDHGWPSVANTCMDAGVRTTQDAKVEDRTSESDPRFE